MSRLFGTDGVRGKTWYGPDKEEGLLLNPELALMVGQAAGFLARELLTGDSQNVVVIGRDTRASGAMLESALVAGFLAQGMDVVLVGVIPTPGIAFLTVRLQAKLGVVISASHNPAEDNGIKLFGPDGFKLSEEMEEQLEGLILDGERPFTPLASAQLGHIRPAQNELQMYADYLVATTQAKADLSGLSVILECAHGATSFIAPEVFRRLGMTVDVLNAAPDGININTSYEYLTPTTLSQRVKEIGAQVGIAFDGDGDRVMMVDERGEVVDGDTILAILARHLQANGRLPGSTVVSTIMCNLGLHESLRAINASVFETKVGDRHVLCAMQEGGYVLGGERSGHVILLENEQTSGDGMYTALAVLAVLNGRPLSELAQVMTRFPQFLGSTAVSPQRPSLTETESVQVIMNWLRAQFDISTDISLRYSGTENKVRLSIRGWKFGKQEQLDMLGGLALKQLGEALSKG